MSKLTIIATIVSKKEDNTEFCKSDEMIKLIDKTCVEDGCINYDSVPLR
ncbi:hypothetical protein O9992_29595 [Vibrio lentus]|nr:hypothetical protein [Vibrio lentus]